MLRFKQVDVFTDRPFLGNPVAVVIGAEGLSAQEMQRIACWTNLSETTFLLKSEVADYRLRIFTPRQELPFAGHPTLGSAHAALESGFVERKARLRQECGAGVLDLEVEGSRIYVKAPQPKLRPVEEPSAWWTRALRVDVGPIWVVAELADTAALADLDPDMAAIAELSESLEATGVTLFARSRGADGAALHVRSFAPAHGVPEDPVCGSGNISVAAYLRETKTLPSEEYLARQGMALGRDGKVSMRVTGSDIYLGGPAVTCVEGELKP